MAGRDLWEGFGDHITAGELVDNAVFEDHALNFSVAVQFDGEGDPVGEFDGGGIIRHVELRDGGEGREGEGEEEE